MYLDLDTIPSMSYDGNQKCNHNLGGVTIMRKRSMKNKVIKQSRTQRKKTIPFIVAIANKVLNAIGFVDYIDSNVKWDNDQSKVSPGNLAKAFILATFFEVRAPLSKIAERFLDIDTEFLFGEGIFPQHLNDDAIGRALDKIAEACPGKLYTTLCMTAYAVYEVAFRKLHSDTTSISFYGDYEIDKQEKSDADLIDEQILQIFKGYNKDNRMGCNQVVVGKIVNEHGIPVASSVMNGNTSDVEWNTNALELVADIFENQLEDMVYIADSKLMNINLFRTMMNPKKKITFISQYPANCANKLKEQVLNKAYKENNWEDLDEISNRKHASKYKAQELIEKVDDKEIRCMVYQTSEGTERFEKKKAKALEDLDQAISKVEKKEFACEADAVKELERFQRGNKKSIYCYSSTLVTEEIKKRPRGNPGKNPKPLKIETKWRLKLNVTGENIDLMKKLQYNKENFVLITNATRAQYDTREVLENYKNQSVVEIQFRLLKEPCIASVIYLKTPDRIRAMVMLLGVSLLIRALVQYKLRKGYSECTKDLPKVGWNGRTLQSNITIFFFNCALQNHAFVRERDNEYSFSYANTFKELQISTLLELMGLTVEQLLED